MTDYDFWRCDECRKLYPLVYEQHVVKIQQNSERIYGTNQMYRPVETLIVCDECWKRFLRGGKT